MIELWGISRNAFLDKKVWELGFLKDIAAYENKFAEFRAREQIRYEDLPLETAAGRPIAVEFVSNVYLVNGHRVIQCNIRDITERKRQEEELRQAKEELEQRVRERTEELALRAGQLQALAGEFQGFFNRNGTGLHPIPSVSPSTNSSTRKLVPPDSSSP